MRIIYEDGDYRNENEEKDLSQQAETFVDISGMSEKYMKETESQDRTGRPYRPAPTLRPSAEKEEKKETAPIQSEAAAQNVQPPQGYMPWPYGAYPQPYVQYPQGYPVQYVPVQYPQNQVYIPQVQYPQQTPYSPVPQQQNTGTAPDAGTRVLYQSPDFDKDKNESAPAVSSPTVYQRRSGITHADVEIPGASQRPLSSSQGSFQVDDMEMSVFELNSISHKYNTKTKAVKNPNEADSTLEVEEYDEEFDFYDDFEPEEEEAPKAKKKKSSKKKKRAETVRKIVLAISVIAIVVSAVVLINEARLSAENRKNEQEYENLIIDTNDSVYIPEDDNSGKDESDTDETEKPEKEDEQEVQLTVEQQWQKVKDEFPNVVFPSDIQLKYARLYGTNREFVGYLSAEGINLSLPVVQTGDDETYLNKNFYGKNTKYGCPFVTHLNNIGTERDSLDMNTVIFGHYMKDGSVFGSLYEYKTIDGFKNAPVITFNTLYHDYSWKVIAAFITNAEEKDDNGYVFKYYFTNLSTQERYSAYLSELSQRSLYDTGVDVLPGDKILTLSTCSYEFEDARFVVVARLVRNGESTDVDTSKATVNPSPRYPQAYYDKKKAENPYKDAYRWEVG